MEFSKLPFYQNKILFGRDDKKNITAIEVDEKSDPCKVILYIRKNGKVEREEDEFHPFALVQNLSLLEGFEEEWIYRELTGNSDYKYIIFCNSVPSVKKLISHLKSTTRSGQGDPQGPYLFQSDMVSQYLLITGRTLFKGMVFEDILRMQIDIETYTEAGYDFSNPDREADRIIMISMSDSTGWERLLSGKDYSEPEMIREMLRIIQERDPDVIEGHNFHKFDLNYLEKRSARYKIKLTIGREETPVTSHFSRLNIAEKTITYPKYSAYGRHIIDTWILAQLYDVSIRSLESYGLKNIAKHFQVASPDRTYVDHSEISGIYDRDPEKLAAYALDDVRETNEISKILSPPYFIQTQIFPLSYQNVTVRGNATRIDSLFLREYINRGCSIPKPPANRAFIGGYTDIFREGIEEHILHVDVASLYPSTMLAFKYFPPKDDLRIFEKLLSDLTSFRLEAKKAAREEKDPYDRNFMNSLQTTFKILINSFYGYLGFSMGHFADFDMAESTTSKGREIILSMVEWMKNRGCTLIELDTDGIYFKPPSDVQNEEEENNLITELDATMPKGINLELDGRYKSMFSYKMKNYILLDYDGIMTIKGSGLKSRGLELFQRKFIEDIFRLVLSGKKEEVENLIKSYRNMIMNRDWDVTWFQKIDSLQESVSNYEEKVNSGKRNRAAAYELALQSGRDYQAGDSIAYYITGEKAAVTAYRACKFASEWNKEKPDENIMYYASKLNELYKKFAKYIK